MNEVTLAEMMDARERRVSVQTHLINQHKLPLVCLTLNIPGPVKVLPKVPGAYEEAVRLIRLAAERNHFPVADMVEIKERTGYEAFFSMDADALEIKKAMVPVEDQDRLGRLFDIDVIGTDGKKISREELGLPARLCLLCGRPAHECSRSRAHSVPELVAYIEKVLDERL